MNCKLCELKINHESDRNTLAAILVNAGYTASMEKRKVGDYPYNTTEYYIIVEDRDTGGGVMNDNLIDLVKTLIAIEKMPKGDISTSEGLHALVCALRTIICSQYGVLIEEEKNG